MSELLDYRLGIVKRYVSHPNWRSRMNQRQFCVLLGLVGQAGCLVYDEPLRRELPDAALDARRDIARVDRDLGTDSPPTDTMAVDGEARIDASLDVIDATDVAVDVAPDLVDAGAMDVVSDRVDVAIDVTADIATPPDVFDAGAEGGDAGDAAARDADATNDVLTDPPITGCTVDFTVSGVNWDDETPVEAGERIVRLVGSLAAIGDWDPSRGLTMIEKAPGAWAASVRLSDSDVLQFKFVKIDGGSAPEWEQWLPFDSNRSLRVDCGSDGGVIWVDAGTDAGPALRAVGRSYGGAFGIRPLDATK
ncbi:MAG: carbohydrate-binding module family 20 domain-containing protein [Polyangiaceae bacterium]